MFLFLHYIVAYEKNFHQFLLFNISTLQDNLKPQLGKKRTKTLSEAQLDVRQFNFIFAVHLIGKCEFSDISGSVILCSRK